MKPKATKAIKDSKDFKVVEVYTGKPLTGNDPVLLALIKKAVKSGS
jgi:hypothetical protein